MSAKIDVAKVHRRKGSGYPAPYGAAVAARVKQGLGDAGRLCDFGVNLTHLPPGTWSSQRHWHTAEDEFVFVVSGELVLITNDGEELLRAGDCAGFPKNQPNGHHLANRSGATAVYLEVGTRAEEADACHYPDIDMHLERAKGFTRKDGTPFP
ncbi:MAG TPA: cupin domain-containing protein [Rhizomicrobium sp.]|jgi:uncharacterized cupin superfamily protein|nr:cupin domain-containing protein [Rhizomicrobium sp.]